MSAGNNQLNFVGPTNLGAAANGGSVGVFLWVGFQAGKERAIRATNAAPPSAPIRNQFFM